MCDVTEGFKLCTCAGLIRADWELQRVLHANEGTRGRVAMPLPFADRNRLLRELPALLDDPTNWDFAADLEEGDVLTFRCFGPDTLEFRYTEQGWVAHHRDFAEYTSVSTGRLSRPHDRVPEAIQPLIRDCEQTPADPDLRLVAADALEEHGATVLAEWLRLEVEHRDGTSSEAFHKVSQRFSARIRARLSGELPIQDCAHRKCPGSWTKLDPTSDDLIRQCKTCRLQVPFIDSTQSRVAPCVHAASAWEPEKKPTWWSWLTRDG